MHHARPWAKEQSARGDEILNRHSTPNLVHLVYLVDLVCLVFGLNETNQMNQINQTDRSIAELGRLQPWVF